MAMIKITPEFIREFFKKRKQEKMGQVPPNFIPPRLPLSQLRAPPRSPNGPFGVGGGGGAGLINTTFVGPITQLTKDQRKKSIADCLITEFDYPSGKVFVVGEGYTDLDAFLFNEFKEGDDYKYRDGKIYIKEQVWTALILKFS